MASSNYTDRLYTAMCSERTLQSDTNGFFLQFADDVINFVGSDWLTDTFAKIQTDRERVRILFADKQISNVVWGTLSNVQCIYREKNAKIAHDKRHDADEFMKEENFNKALVYYCQSVLRAPSKGVDLFIDAGKSLALALWGRAHALMALGEFRAAIDDLQLSLKEGLHDTHKAQLYLRMALCWEHLNDTKRAKVSYGLAEKLYGSNKEQMQSDKGQIKIGTLLDHKAEKRKYLPKVTKGSNDTLKNASCLLALKESEEMGKYFVAKRAVSTGDVLVVEQPRAACLLPDCFGTHCHHCFKRFLAPIGCPICSNLAFCSLDCRDTSCKTYHKYECKILSMLIGSGMSILCHVALRMITQDGLENCLQIYKNRSSDNVSTLCTHADKRETKDFLQRTLMAAFLLRCLQKCDFFPGRDESNQNEMYLSEEEIIIGEMILFYLQILQFNAHEIYETKYSATHRFNTARTAYIGVGIYPTIAFFNHECDPGVIRYYVDKQMVIVAARPHRVGEMVAENYGPIFVKRNLAERQRSLLSRYWFKCQCLPCKENWIGFDKLQNGHARFRCPNSECKNLFAQSARDDDRVEVMCPKCKRQVCLKEAIAKLNICEKQYQLGFDAVQEEETKKAMALFTEAINLFYSIACPPHKDTHLAQLTLRTCFADFGNTYQCLVPS